MTTRAPELALIVGLVLGGTMFATALVFSGSLYQAVLAGAVLCYPFAAYAVVHDDEPTTVLFPQPILIGGAIAGLLVLLDVGRVGTPRAIMYGASLALLVFLPAAAYSVAHGTAPVSADVGFVSTLVLGVTLLWVNPLVGGSPYGAIGGGLLLLSGILYAHHTGPIFTPTTRKQLVIGGMLLGGSLLVAGFVLASVLATWVASAIAAIVAPAVGYAITIDAV